MTRLDWTPIIERARQIARSYSTPPTLRQVFYRLVAAPNIPNTESAYKRLSAKTAEARREGWFPDLTDGTRDIEQPLWYRDTSTALADLADAYRLDRRRGQEAQVWVVVEKATLSMLAYSSVERFSVPVVPLRGYGSQTIIDRVSRSMWEDERPAIVFYVGDFDPTGEDIDRDFRARLGFDSLDFERLAVTPIQITDMNLPPLPGKTTDSRAARFMERHGRLVQVEAEAIDPQVLGSLIGDAVEDRVDLSLWQSVVDEEREDRERLRALA